MDAHTDMFSWEISQCTQPYWLFRKCNSYPCHLCAAFSPLITGESRETKFLSFVRNMKHSLTCDYKIWHTKCVAVASEGTVYPKKYAHGFVVLCFVVVMQSFIMNSHEVFIHIHQGCFAGTGAIVRLPQCQWSKPDGYGKISQCITTTKHSKAKTVCTFLGIYCTCLPTICEWDSKNGTYSCEIKVFPNHMILRTII